MIKSETSIQIIHSYSIPIVRVKGVCLCVRVLLLIGSCIIEVLSRISRNKKYVFVLKFTRAQTSKLSFFMGRAHR